MSVCLQAPAKNSLRNCEPGAAGTMKHTPGGSASATLARVPVRTAVARKPQARLLRKGPLVAWWRWMRAVLRAAALLAAASAAARTSTASTTASKWRGDGDG